MLAWLINHLGKECVTYIKIILILAALVGAGVSLKLIKSFRFNKKNVKQKANVNDGTSIQIAGDMRINNVDKTRSRDK